MEVKGELTTGKVTKEGLEGAARPLQHAAFFRYFITEGSHVDMAGT